MTETLWLRNVRPRGGDAEDIRIADGRIAERRPAAAGDRDGGWIDGRGRLLLPALVESHAHLDKTLWGQPWRSNSAGPTLKDYIDNERRVLAGVEAPILTRAGDLLEQYIRRGTLALRSHVDVAPDIGLSHVEGMLALRELYAPWVDLQFVAFPQMGLLSRPGTLELMREAVRLGVETVGGLDPCGIDGDPIRHLEAIFSLAAEFDRGVDIHLHDPGELGFWQIARIVEFTERFERQGRVMISHAYCLGSVPWQRVAPLAERLAANAVSLATTAPADTGVPPFLKLRAAGVNVCLGCDGIRDAWSPLGNGDMLEKAMMQAYRFDLCKDEELAAAFDAASGNGARALGLDGYGLDIGDRADLLLLPAENLPEAVVSRPAARTLLRAGRIVVEDGDLLIDPRAAR